MRHPGADLQFDPLTFQRLLHHRMPGPLQFRDRMPGQEIFLEREAAPGDRIVGGGDTHIIRIEQEALVEPAG